MNVCCVTWQRGIKVGDGSRLIIRWLWDAEVILYLEGSPGISDSKESACIAGDLGLILGSGRSPGEGNGNPHQYSCLKISVDRERFPCPLPWTDFHGRLQSMGLWRVGCDGATHTHNVITRVLKSRRGRQWCKRKCQNAAAWDSLHQALLAFKDGERGP